MHREVVVPPQPRSRSYYDDKPMSSVTNLVAVEGWKTLKEQFGNATEGLEGEQAD